MSDKELDELLYYYDKPIQKGVKELELRFYAKHTKEDYDNVIKKLISLGFKTNDEYGMYRLGIQTDKSFIRTEVIGITSIQKYCKTNNVADLMNEKYNVQFNEKNAVLNDKKEKIKNVNFQDYQFLVSYKVENIKSYESPQIKEMSEKWTSLKKSFRYINRVSYTHDDYPFIVDMTILKTSKKNKDGSYVEGFTMDDILHNDITYEIEIEIDNEKAKKRGMDIKKNIKTGVKIILSGLQESNYPISLKEQNAVVEDYLKLVKTKEHKKSKQFIGPSSITLQLKNLIEETNNPCVLYDYVVTDKADGSRHLLYIHTTGKIYYIDTSLKIKFSGFETNKHLGGTLLDGEYIIHDKNGRFIHLFAAFDVYFVKSEDVRERPFFRIKEAIDKKKYRYEIIEWVVMQIDNTSIIRKSFYYTQKMGGSLFESCSKIWEKKEMMLYEIDGLIITNALFGVGADKENEKGDNKKITWKYSFKWKPPEFNTIDFLVIIKKNEGNKDIIYNKYQEGMNSTLVEQIQKYKTVELHCGYNTSQIVNPLMDLINNKYPTTTNKYISGRFFPSDPFDLNAGITNIMLQTNQNLMLTESENKEIIENEMIVEFKYDVSKEDGWNWVPIRVRYDKTYEYKTGQENYGNYYEVANENWYSIHNPITVDMITTGNNIPKVANEIYYNPAISKDNNTQGLRNFHNLYVKKKLIVTLSKKDDILIDFSCGKAGDLPKWIDAGLKFVFGVDISKDNIENKIDGACVRYLNYRRNHKHIPDVLFAIGNSTEEIKTGHQMSGLSKIITQTIFGIEKKPMLELEKYQGIAKDGFDLGICNFSIHYFFSDLRSLCGFVKNVVECTKIGGLFIGTTYDGQTIFNKLKNVEYLQLNQGKTKIFELIKKYNHVEFPNTAKSLGYRIDVYQESIGQLIPEYLVNFDFFVDLMNQFGFELIPNEEATSLGLPGNSAMFRKLFEQMMQEINLNQSNNLYGKASLMTKEEKEISFLNRYFIFRKTANIDAKKLTETLTKETHPIQDNEPIHKIKIKKSEEDETPPEEKEDDVEEINVDENKKLALDIKNIKIIIHKIIKNRTTGDKIFSILSQNNFIVNSTILYQLSQIIPHQPPDKDRQKFISDKLSNYLKTLDLKNPLIVDIGGGNGDVLKNIGHSLKIDKNHLFVVEQKTPWSEPYPFSNGDYLNYIYWDNNKIPEIKPHSANVILIMVSMHHMTDSTIQHLFDNLNRIAKPNAIVIIKEHDLSNPDKDKLVIDWEHHLYHLAESKNPTKNELSKYLEHYVDNFKSKQYFDELFVKNDYEQVQELNRLFEKMPDDRNPTNLYWKIYQRNIPFILRKRNTEPEPEQNNEGEKDELAVEEKENNEGEKDELAVEEKENNEEIKPKRKRRVVEKKETMKKKIRKVKSETRKK
jgi:hypothetical protein